MYYTHTHDHHHHHTDTRTRTRTRTRTTCSSTETISPSFFLSAQDIAVSPSCIGGLRNGIDMADAATTRPRHLHLGSSALNTRNGTQPLHRHHHPTGETDTHILFSVDVSLGFEQLDHNVGMHIVSSTHQRRPTTLRTHDGMLRDRPEVCGHHSSDTHVIFGVDVSLGFEYLDDSVGIPIQSSKYQRRHAMLRTHNDTLRDRPEVCGHPPSDTHSINFGVDVGLGFEQLDDSGGMRILSSFHQRRVTILRTHNDILRDRPEVCVHPSSGRHYYATLQHQNTLTYISASGLMPDASSLLTS